MSISATADVPPAYSFELAEAPVSSQAERPARVTQVPGELFYATKAHIWATMKEKFGPYVPTDPTKTSAREQVPPPADQTGKVIQSHGPLYEETRAEVWSRYDTK